MAQTFTFRKSATRRGYAPTLGWYLARRWLRAAGLTLLALGAFIGLVNALEALRQVAGTQVPATEAVLFSLLRLPDVLMQLLPFAVLLGTLAWLHGLQRTSELVALRATGLPVRRIVLSALISALLLGVAGVFIGNPLSAALLKRHEKWEHAALGGSPSGVLTASGSLWLKHEIADPAKVGAASRTHTVFLYGAKVEAQGTQLLSATAFVFDASNTLSARLDANRATLERGAWRLQTVTQLRQGQNVSRTEAVLIPTSLTPTQLAASLNPPPTLNVWELQRIARILRQNGWPSGAHAVAFANLMALPGLCVAMLLLALPFGLGFRRVGGVARTMAVGLGLGFGFYVLRNTAAAYAVAGRLEPWLAAAVPVIVALLLALFLLILLREE